MREQIGVKFNFKTDWRALFQRDAWFLWQRVYNKDDIVLRRFTIFNVLKWYCFQLIIRLVTLIFIPTLRLAHKYWNNTTEGAYLKFVAMDLLITMPKIKFFRMGIDRRKDYE